MDVAFLFFLKYIYDFISTVWFLLTPNVASELPFGHFVDTFIVIFKMHLSHVISYS